MYDFFEFVDLLLEIIDFLLLVKIFCEELIDPVREFFDCFDDRCDEITVLYGFHIIFRIDVHEFWEYFLDFLCDDSDIVFFI